MTYTTKKLLKFFTNSRLKIAKLLLKISRLAKKQPRKNEKCKMKNFRICPSLKHYLIFLSVWAKTLSKFDFFNKCSIRNWVWIYCYFAMHFHILWFFQNFRTSPSTKSRRAWRSQKKNYTAYQHIRNLFLNV